jgi:hypothetical protein
MHNIPNKIMKQITKAMKRPEGKLEFKFTCEELFNSNVSNIKIFEVVTGAQIFILERDKNMTINFYHSSPGTGTRIATINLEDLPETNRMSYAITWNETKIYLYVHPLVEGYELIKSEGDVADKSYQVDRNGNIIQLGDEGIEIMRPQIIMEGEKVLEPTAINSWQDTLKAIDILKTGKSDEGYIYEVVVCNYIISSLVTGFETYSKKRFIELEKEGINPNIDDLIDRIFSSYEKNEIDLPNKLKVKAEEKSVSHLEIIAQEKINFQNFDECKKAFNKAYNLRFGDIIEDTNKINELRQFIKYRHKIIHVSPLETILNNNNPSEDTVFSSKDLASEAIDIFSFMINKIHNASLKLRNEDNS